MKTETIQIPLLESNVMISMFDNVIEEIINQHGHYDGFTRQHLLDEYDATIIGDAYPVLEFRDPKKATLFFLKFS
jgi:hypothetical protein